MKFSAHLGRRCVLAAALVLSTAPVARAQGTAPIPCSGDAETPAFLSAANDIYYGCGYLVVSTPPQYAMAATNFRQALAKEPENAAAKLLLGLALAGAGEREEARTLLAEAVRAEPQVLERAAPLFARRPSLRQLMDQVTAPAQTPSPAPERTRGTGSATPRAAAPRAAPQAPRPFAVGAAVEVEHLPGQWVPGVVTSADPGPCPYYRVAHDPYGSGEGRELGFVCGAVRAPTGVRQPQPECGGSNPNCPPASPPPLGTYSCSVVRWDVASRRSVQEYKGYFVLLPGGRYRWLDNGGSGIYRYDAATHRIRWGSGFLQSQGGEAVYGLDGKTPEITITLDSDYSRRTGNAAPQWQCSLRGR